MGAERWPRSLAALALACSACGGGGVTNLHVKALFDGRAAIDQLRFELLDGTTPLIEPTVRPERAGGPLPTGAGVAILLADRWAGHQLTARVTGRAAMMDRLAGSAPVTPLRGLAVEVDVSLDATAEVPPSTIVVAPATVRAASGDALQLAATGHFADGDRDITGRVSWTTSDPAVATVAAGGHVTAKRAGSATISASWDPASGSAMLVVSDASLSSIEVTFAAATLHPAQMQQYKALGHYSDASTQDLTAQATWSSSSPTVASVSDATGSKGLATALVPGATQIEAAFGMMTGQAPLTVQ